MATLITIWFLHAAALLVPGANVLFVSYLAASDRKTAAIFASIGIAIGSGIWATAAVLGVKSLFLAFPQVRLLIQVLGAIYLFYIAIRLFQSPVQKTAISKTPVSNMKAFLQGLVVNLTNPKAAIFFGSIFSATFPESPDNPLLISAVILIVINGLCWHVLLSFIFSDYKIQAAYSKYMKLINRLVSTLFGTLGAYLLMTALGDAKN